MLKRSENASDPRAKVLGKLHKALRHSALSTIVSPSYAIGCIPPINVQRQEHSDIQDAQYDDLMSFLYGNGPKGHTENAIQRRLLELRSKIEGKQISHFLTKVDDQPTVSHDQSVETMSPTPEKQDPDFMEMDDTNALLDVRSDNAPLTEIQSDLVMEEPSEGMGEATLMSVMDIQMEDTAAVPRQDDILATYEAPKLRYSSSTDTPTSRADGTLTRFVTEDFKTLAAARGLADTTQLIPEMRLGNKALVREPTSNTSEANSSNTSEANSSNVPHSDGSILDQRHTDTACDTSPQDSTVESVENDQRHDKHGAGDTVVVDKSNSIHDKADVLDNGHSVGIDLTGDIETAPEEATSDNGNSHIIGSVAPQSHILSDAESDGLLPSSTDKSLHHETTTTTLLHQSQDTVADISLPDATSYPEDERKKDINWQQEEDFAQMDSEDADTMVPDNDLTTWKDQRDEALNSLKELIHILTQQENKLLQYKSTNTTEEHIDSKIYSNVASMFDCAGDAILLSRPATKRTLALIRKANKYGQLPNVEGEDLSWLLKTMERSVRNGCMAVPMQYHSGQGEFVGGRLEDLDTTALEHGIDSTLTIFSILTSTKLDKKLYAEELITSCLNFTKMILTDVVSPAYDSLNNIISNGETTEFNQYHNRSRQTIIKFSLHLSRILNQLYRFIQQEDVSDDMVITLSYISIPPFFLQSKLLMDTNAKSPHDHMQTSDNPIDEVKASAMDVLRCVFSKYPKHRSWIVDEILANVIHVSTDVEFENRYRIASGTSIHAISALVLQIVQCCTDTDRSNERSWTQKWELKYQKSNDNRTKLNESLINKVLATSIAGIESCTETSQALLQQLLTKSLKQSSEDQASAEYRRILNILISDAMEVLNEPEWPAAEVIVRIFSTILMNIIDDSACDVQKRNLATEFIGAIAGRVYNSEHSETEDHEHADGDDANESNYLIRGDADNCFHVPVKQSAIMESHKAILEYLRSRIDIDTISKSAIQYYLCQWGYTFSSIWKSGAKTEDTGEGDEAKVQQTTQSMVYAHVKYIWDLLLEEKAMWTAIEDSNYDRQDVKVAAEKLMFERPLYKSYQAMLSRIFTSLDIESVSTRAAALRALINLSAKDVSFMEKQQVQVAIVRRMQDVSPSVRDAAIKLAGNYLASHPAGTLKYLAAISERILDTSINVRKRVMRILKNVYAHANDDAVEVDIGSKIVERVADDIMAVRETAVKTSLETIFSPWSITYTRKRKNDYVEFEYLPPDFKKEVLQRCNILLQIFASLEKSGCSSSLENILVLIVDSLDDKTSSYINSMFNVIIGCLFSELLRLEDAGDTASITNCIGLIHCFSKSSPRLFTQSLMTMLEPYLKASAANDYKALYHAIQIYDTVLPFMKRPDPMFLADSELTLTKLVVSCPILVLTAVISCLSTISHKLTHNYGKIASIMYGCIEKLRQEKDNVVQLRSISSSQRLIRLCMITGLLCQHCNFDVTDQVIDRSDRLRELCQNGVASETFELLYFFAANRVTGEHIDQQSSNQIKLAALQSLGYLYIQYPKYMVTKKSTTMMDEMFASRILDYKSRVLRVFLDFLVGEEKRIIEREKETSRKHTTMDLSKLLGNASEMAELSVSSSLMQRYLERILQTALDANVQLRNLSFKVITHIVQQGLAHPVICMPAIVALETCPDQIMRDKAFQLHFQLNQRHQVLLYSRNVDCVRAAYDYNRRLLGDATKVYGHLGEEFEYEALLQPMYSLIAEKLKVRNDFIISITKLFDIEMNQNNQHDSDIYFYRFIAQNLVGMRYKTIEEPLCIVYAINKILSTTAMNLMSALHLEMDNEFESDQNNTVSSRSRRRKQRNEIKRLNEEEDIELDADSSLKYSMIMSMLLHAKQVLKYVYSLTEEKCQQYHPEDSNTYKTKAITHQPPIPMYNNVLLELPVFKMHDNEHASVDTACKYFAKLMMNDTLGTGSLEHDQNSYSSSEEGPMDIFNNISPRKSKGKP